MSLDYYTIDETKPLSSCNTIILSWFIEQKEIESDKPSTSMKLSFRVVIEYKDCVIRTRFEHSDILILEKSYTYNSKLLFSIKNRSHPFQSLAREFINLVSCMCKRNSEIYHLRVTCVPDGPEPDNPEQPPKVFNYSYIDYVAYQKTEYENRRKQHQFIYDEEDDEDEYFESPDFNAILNEDSLAGYVLIAVVKDWFKNMYQLLVSSFIDNKENVCPISLEPLVKGATYVLPCGHMVSKDGFEPLKTSSTFFSVACPVCRHNCMHYNIKLY